VHIDLIDLQIAKPNHRIVAMQRQLIGLGAFVLLALAVTTATAGPPIHLKRSTASYATQETVNRRFSESFLNRAGGSVNCKRKVSFNVRHCKIQWVIGDAYYAGGTTVGLYERANRSRLATVSYRIHEIDEYCVFVRHEPVARCDRHFRGRTRVGL
jgi:hypothetical protein